MLELLERLHHDANECRSLAETAITSEGREVLCAMAEAYEKRAAIFKKEGLRSHDLLWWR